MERKIEPGAFGRVVPTLSKYIDLNSLPPTEFNTLFKALEAAHQQEAQQDAQQEGTHARRTR